MSAVQIKRGPKGYVVKAYFSNLPAALCAADRALSVCETAFEPVLSDSVADPAAVKLALALEMAESDDMPAHDGRLNPPSQDEE